MLLSVVGVVFALTAVQAADDYPNKPVLLVICFGAGGGLDVDLDHNRRKGRRAAQQLCERQL